MPQNLLGYKERGLRKMEGIKNMVGKRVYVILKNNRQYSGTVNEVHDSGNGLIFVDITDKFGKVVVFYLAEIELIEEEGK